MSYDARNCVSTDPRTTSREVPAAPVSTVNPVVAISTAANTARLRPRVCRSWDQTIRNMSEAFSARALRAVPVGRGLVGTASSRSLAGQQRVVSVRQ
ncbi:hypothetical protein ACFQZ8_13020 [Micromonospora azadirachtae]|uniref:Uncharacterized protein n=1 Tax=Micromonospora azadirachtae TaxID=1970735 RepID=A0ABW3A2D3_9ACTN